MVGRFSCACTSPADPVWPLQGMLPEGPQKGSQRLADRSTVNSKTAISYKRYRSGRYRNLRVAGRAKRDLLCLVCEQVPVRLPGPFVYKYTARRSQHTHGPEDGDAREKSNRYSTPKQPATGARACCAGSSAQPPPIACMQGRLYAEPRICHEPDHGMGRPRCATRFFCGYS